MKMKSAFLSRRAFAVSCGATLLAAAASMSAAQTSGPPLEGTIKIDSLLSLTGPAAFAGLSTQEGMNFALEEINGSDYLGKAELSINYVDVALSTDQATAAVRGFIDNDSVAIVGVTLGNHALAIAPLAQRAKVPFVAANTGGLTALTQAGDYVYQVDVAQLLYAGKMADVLKEKGVQTTAVLYNDDVPAIRDLWNAYSGQELPRVGIKADPVINVVSTATDHSAAITTLLAAKADAIGVLTRAGTPAAIAQLRQLGYEGIIWGQAGLAGGVAVKAAPATEGVLFTANAAAGSSSPTMEKFFREFEKKTGKPAYAFAAQGYDAVWAVAHALKNGGCASRECVQTGLQQLMKTGFEGALGDLTFKDRNAIGPGSVVQIVDGKEEFVK
jgi:branched-chain amino acid transport system substrate-binding protein